MISLSPDSEYIGINGYGNLCIKNIQGTNNITRYAICDNNEKIYSIFEKKDFNDLINGETINILLDQQYTDILMRINFDKSSVVPYIKSQMIKLKEKHYVLKHFICKILDNQIYILPNQKPEIIINLKDLLDQYYDQICTYFKNCEELKFYENENTITMAMAFGNHFIINFNIDAKQLKHFTRLKNIENLFYVEYFNQHNHVIFYTDCENRILTRLCSKPMQILGDKDVAFTFE